MRIVVAALAFAATLACGRDPQPFPDGAVAVVGAQPLTAEALVAVEGQLGAYARRRFRGPEGAGQLLEAVIDAELLAQEAIDHGLGDDPRVRWALVEEVAAGQLDAELERRVPHTSVVADTAALREYYDLHPAEFTAPERRQARGILVNDFAAADTLVARLDVGARLEDLGPLVTTEPQARDDDAFPNFHALLFAPELKIGDRLPGPVIVSERVLVGVLTKVEPPKLAAFDHPEVRDRLVAGVRQARVEAAKVALMAELRERWPTVRP